MKNLGGETTKKTEESTSTTATTTFKRETRGEAEAEENKTEPRETTYCATPKRLRYNDKWENEDETGGKVLPVYQETKSE